MKTKIGTEVASPRHTWLGYQFQGQKVKGQLAADVLNSQHANRCHLANKYEDIVNLQGAEAYRSGRPPTACLYNNNTLM